MRKFDAFENKNLTYSTFQKSGISCWLQIKNIKMEHKDLEISYDLSISNLDTLVEIDIGNIHLPTGKIIVSDPFFTTDALPPLS